MGLKKIVTDAVRAPEYIKKIRDAKKAKDQFINAHDPDAARRNK